MYSWTVTEDARSWVVTGNHARADTDMTGVMGGNA